MPTSNEINIDGEYYWVMCPSESDKPLIAEQTHHCWYLTGSEKVFRKDDIEILQGPIRLHSL